MKNKLMNRLIIIAVLVSMLLPAIIPAGAVLAENAGGSGGSGGGESGCNWIPSTCFGAGWYAHPFEKGNLVLPGGFSYAISANISKEQCHGAKYVIYYGQARPDGSAQGLTTIGSGDWTWRSSMMPGGGGNRYRGPLGWDTVVEQYAIAYERGTELAAQGFSPAEMFNPVSRLSWFCSNLDEEPEPTPPPAEKVACVSGSLPGLFMTENAANSAAESAVSNYTKAESWQLHTSHSAKNFTLAKPGDSIGFRHSYCYGASAVQYNTAYGAARQYIPPIESRFRIDAKSTNGGTKEYRFGGAGTKAETKLQNSIFDREIKIMVQAGNIVGGDSAIASHLDYFGKYGFTTYSPAVDAGDRYDCINHKPFVDVDYKFVSPGYQTTGFNTLKPIASPACKSYDETGPKHDAGTTITQSLDWTQTRAFIKDFHIDNGGECDCEPKWVGKNTWLVENDVNEVWPGSSEYGQQQPDLTYCQDKTCTDTYSIGTFADDPNDPESEPYEHFETDEWAGWYKPPYKLLFREGPRDEPGDQMREEVHALIPYNYDTSASSAINAGPTTYIGEYVNTSFNWSINPRSNPDVYEYGYATISRPSRVLIMEFTVSADDMAYPGAVEGGFFPDEGGGANGVIGYYGGKLQITSQNTIYDVGGVEYNETGDPNGDFYSYEEARNRKLPDAEPGTKYCVAMGIWPTDSHNRPNEGLGAGVNDLGKINNGQRGNYSGNKWRISGASCRTLYKKPNFQVWGAGLYTGGSIKTSTSAKNPGDWMGAYGGNSHLFGSWDEYAVIANGTVNKFSSAAGYGYEPNKQIQPTGGAVAGRWDFCQHLSRMTLGGCNNGLAGPANVSVADTVLERLKARYLPTANETGPNATHISGGYCNAVSDKTKCIKLTSGATYIEAKNNATINRLIVGRSGLRADGNVDNQGTIIIDARNKTINIGDNICYLDNGCDSNNAIAARAAYGTSARYQVRNYLQSRTNINNIATLPQVLIFAKNIRISQRASQVDAWLIADDTLNTCAEFTPGYYQSDSNSVVAGTPSTACHLTLNLNGPVFAGSLALNRTAGADPGRGTPNPDVNWPHQQNLADDGSVTPAEIFNLRPDSYFWAYSQAQRYSQAVVTYSRELAPRF